MPIIALPALALDELASGPRTEYETYPVDDLVMGRPNGIQDVTSRLRTDLGLWEWEALPSVSSPTPSIAVFGTASVHQRVRGWLAAPRHDSADRAG